MNDINGHSELLLNITFQKIKKQEMMPCLTIAVRQIMHAFA